MNEFKINDFVTIKATKQELYNVGLTNGINGCTGVIKKIHKDFAIVSFIFGEAFVPLNLLTKPNQCKSAIFSIDLSPEYQQLQEAYVRDFINQQ